MLTIDRKKIKEEFAAYVADYDTEDEKIKLKIIHTYQVADLCERIAEDLGLAKEDIDLAWSCGMLHDIGRFEQLRRYNTFVDSVSIDHAAFGVELLFGEEQLIRRFFPADADMSVLREAILYHSAYRLPEDMDERCRLFSNILRDADKVDIFRVNIETPLEEIYNTTTEELYSCQVTEEVMEAFRQEHAVLRALKKTPIDNVVGHIALTFELVYPISVKIAAEQGYLQQLLQFSSHNAKTRQQFEEIRNRMEQFLWKKTANN
jgi:putative nucleotidyltransferase with HDIG domain